MMSKTLLVGLIGSLLVFSSCDKNVTSEAEDSTLTIAVGSCNRTDLPQVMWGPIVENNPDVFIWLGDIVYGDTHDMSLLASKYQTLKEEPGYQDLLQQARVIGVWDDHDYGVNDAGKYYSKKDSSKLVLAGFLDVSDDDPVRQRKGMYSSHSFGSHPFLTKIILLDARYFRDTVITDPSPDRRYMPNENGDILGEAQWSWLEEELGNSNADLHIIGSGIQFLPEEHGWEKWSNFPKSRHRLLDLLTEKKPKNTLLISGDRHIAEISKMSLDDDFEVYELTSSGLTHTWNRIWDEPNQYRLGKLIAKKNFGIIKISAEQVELQVRGEMDSLFTSLKIPLQ